MIHRRGHGLHQHDEHRAQPVADLEAGTGASRHDDTQRKTQRQSNAQGDQSQLQRDGDLLGNDLGNGDALAVDVGFSQVPVEHLLVKAHQLGGQGSGHAKGLKLDLNLGGAHFIVILEIPFHGHQPQQGKEDRDNDKHGDEGAQNALGYISGHMMSSWGFSPFIRFPNKMVKPFYLSTDVDGRHRRQKMYGLSFLRLRRWPFGKRPAKTVFNRFNETGIRADTAAAFAVAAPVQAPKNCLWSNTVYMRL